MKQLVNPLAASTNWPSRTYRVGSTLPQLGGPSRKSSDPVKVQTDTDPSISRFNSTHATPSERKIRIVVRALSISTAKGLPSSSQPGSTRCVRRESSVWLYYSQSLPATNKNRKSRNSLPKARRLPLPSSSNMVRSTYYLAGRTSTEEGKPKGTWPRSSNSLGSIWGRGP